MAGLLERVFHSGPGQAAAGRLGLPEAAVLRRGRTLPEGQVVLAALAGSGLASATLTWLGVAAGEPVVDAATAPDEATRTATDHPTTVPDEAPRAATDRPSTVLEEARNTATARHFTVPEEARNTATARPSPVPEERPEERGARHEGPPTYRGRLGALVVDACGLRRIDELESVRAVLRPAMNGLAGSGRVVLIADADVDGVEANAVRQALDGIMRTVGKELRRGATANLILVASGTTPADLASTLSFLLEGRSAFVDGQAWSVGPALRDAGSSLAGSSGTVDGESSSLAGSPGTVDAESTPPAGSPGTVGPALRDAGSSLAGSSGTVGGDPVPEELVSAASERHEGPLAGRIVVITGAARGIGAQIATVAARDGARVVCVDMPAAGEALAHLANRLRGTALQLDITSPDAGERIAAHVASRHGTDARIHGIVHNAGITRDKLLVNTDAQRWAQVLAVNLQAELRINPVLLDGRPGGLADGGRIVGVASTSGIAGNRGQANYAASKAGVIGLVRAAARELAGRGITVNAVAPGFIETEMTARIPFVQREVFRRVSSLGQGGQPVDVAETIGYFLDPASAGVTGQVVRVCGQNLVGA